MQVLKKLGAKQILGSVAKVVKAACEKVGDVISLYTIYGTAKGIKTGVGTYGEWTAFIGDMEAINHVTGEEYSSPQCFIPEPLSSMLKTALAENDVIEFGFVVHAKRLEDDDNGGISYEYIVEPKTELKRNDSLAHLRTLSLAPPAPIENIEAGNKKKAAKGKAA